jgi:Holliday junction DNA helicase RuvB
MQDRTILNTSEIIDDIDASIRPSLLSEFVGQENLKENLQIFLAAAKKRGEPLDHVLLYGPPGLGKTTISQIIAREMGVNLKATAGPILSKAADLAAILTNLQENDVLFIDEIHRLSIQIEEILYPAMEDCSLDLIIGDGPAARTMRINLPKFTLVGATTRLGLISNPLRDRFGIPLRLNFYSTRELKKVIQRGATIMKIEISDNGAEEIARRSRGTPRIALRLLRRVRDFASFKLSAEIDEQVADYALNKLEVDKMGLDSNDIRYLKFISDHYGEKPVGVETIAAALSEQRDSIEETIEPYLMQIGFLHRTPRGRVLTDAAFAHLFQHLL